MSLKLLKGEPHRWEVNYRSGNGLVPSGTKPLPEPMTQIYVITWQQWVNSQQPSSASHQPATIHLHSISPQSIGQHYCRYLTTAAGPEIESPGSLTAHCTSINTKLLAASWGSDHISHYSDLTWASLLLKSLATQLFVQQVTRCPLHLHQHHITACFLRLRPHKPLQWPHMSVIASEITGNSIACSTVHSLPTAPPSTPNYCLLPEAQTSLIHYSSITWVSLHLKSLANQLFV